MGNIDNCNVFQRFVILRLEGNIKRGDKYIDEWMDFIDSIDFLEFPVDGRFGDVPRMCNLRPLRTVSDTNRSKGSILQFRTQKFE